MITGKQGLYAPWAVLAVLVLGCAPAEPVTRDETEQQLAELQDQLENLRAQNHELQVRDTIQSQQIEELEARNERLTELVNELQFDNKMLRRHVEALAPAPRERDRLKEENEQLREQVEQLRRRLEAATQPESTE